MAETARQTPDPRVRDLRREDLQFAHDYHHAGAEAKHAIKSLFSADVSDEQRAQAAQIILLMLRYPETLNIVAAHVQAYVADRDARRKAARRDG